MVYSPNKQGNLLGMSKYTNICIYICSTTGIIRICTGSGRGLSQKWVGKLKVGVFVLKWAGFNPYVILSMELIRVDQTLLYVLLIRKLCNIYFFIISLFFIFVIFFSLKLKLWTVLYCFVWVGERVCTCYIKLKVVIFLLLLFLFWWNIVIKCQAHCVKS